MLGNEIDDSCGAETGEVVPGLGLLPVKTVFSLEKHRTRVKVGFVRNPASGAAFRAVNVPVMKSIWARAVFAKKSARDLYSLPTIGFINTRRRRVRENVAGTYLQGF